jgi:serine/threonine-protein kinase
VYATSAEQIKRDLVWVTRDGKAQSVDPDWQGGFMTPALSPDGKRLAVTLRPSGQMADIWIKQLDRGASIRLTFDGLDHFGPAWTPDGSSVTYASNAVGWFDLWTKPANGSGQPTVQLTENRNLGNPRWSPDGKWLLFNTSAGDLGRGDIRAIRPGLDTTAVTLVSTPFAENSPAVSPDGRWLAYSSDEAGQFEVYIVPFPNTGAGKWAVSTHGGREPQWSHKGNELFYRDGNENMVAVELSTTPTFSIGRVVTLFSARPYSTDFDPSYAVSADDRRFLMVRPLTSSGFDKLIVVDNWFEELKAKSRR